MNEWARKTIHLAGTALPLAYHAFFNKEQFSLFCIVASVLLLIAEAGRTYVTFLKRIYETYLASLLRSGEFKAGLNGATWMMLGMTVTVLLFEKEIAVAAMLLLTISDALAALIGKKWGRPFLFGKSVHGFMAFFISAAAILLLLGLPAIAAFAVALVSAVVEILPLPLNDNLSVPLVAAASLFLMNGYFV